MKVSGSTILSANGLHHEPGVEITVRRGVKYLEDQKRRCGRDKMLPLFSRILKLRESPSEQVLNNDFRYMKFIYLHCGEEMILRDPRS